jgi:outer membrane protein assembly factor BamB
MGSRLPILVNFNGTRLIVTMTAESIIGIDAEKGDFLWRIPQFQRNKIHANPPLYFDGKILCSSESAKSNSGLVQLLLTENGKSVKLLWRNEKFTNLMGGLILKDNFIYGAKYQKAEWYCINWDTGEIQYISRDPNGGNIIYVDGLFYCYSENGEMTLVDASPNGFKMINTFKIPLGTGQHWAHPVIQDGRLYVRHGNALMVYDVRKK